MNVEHGGEDAHLPITKKKGPFRAAGLWAAVTEFDISIRSLGIMRNDNMVGEVVKR
jgi:hypothetical protein